jgi:hypothetical protein
MTMNRVERIQQTIEQAARRLAYRHSGLKPPSPADPATHNNLTERDYWDLALTDQVRKEYRSHAAELLDIFTQHTEKPRHSPLYEVQPNAHDSEWSVIRLNRSRSGGREIATYGDSEAATTVSGVLGAFADREV